MSEVEHLEAELEATADVLERVSRTLGEVVEVNRHLWGRVERLHRELAFTYLAVAAWGVFGFVIALSSGGWQEIAVIATAVVVLVLMAVERRGR